MVQKLPSTDVVIVGFGWAGSIMANELTDAGLNVTCFERGPWRDTARDFSINTAPDELRYNARLELMVPAAQNACTARHDSSQTAVPMRKWGSVHPGYGTGGAGAHWAAISWRFQPDIFQWRSHLSQRYSANAIGPDLSYQDWGVSYDELEPFYEAWEKLAGIGGKAGNLKGEIIPGGNPFEGPRQSEYPNPPMMQSYAPTLFTKAAAELGYKPFPSPSAMISAPYTNSLGLRLAPCTFCGFCTNYGCANYSKASPNICVIPALMRKSNITVRTDSEVLKINLDSTGKKATGVTFVDKSGQEFEQPADLVIVTAFPFENVRLMLLSGIGQPYDPATGKGTTGRNYAYQTPNSITGFFENQNFNPFVGGGAAGAALDELNNDNFDHSGLGFFGGGSTRMIPIGGAPIGIRPTPKGTPRWGTEWKKATKENYLSTISISCEASSSSTPQNYLSLDPTYKDRYGRPLLRITFNWPENDRKMSQYVSNKCAEIMKAMGAKSVEEHPIQGDWDVRPYQSSHVTGGFVMGADPTTSSVNRYLQSWDVPNLFVVGASAFPQNAGYNPTGTVAALAFWAAHAIRTHYLKQPGALVTK